jgi:Zn-dependent protease
MFRLTFQLGSLPVAVQGTFLIVPLWAVATWGMTRGLVWSLIVFSSVLVHELGHALMMRRFGFGADIEIQAFGGVTRLISNGRNPLAKERFLYTLSGPMLELFLGVVMLVGALFVDQQTLLGFALQNGALFNLFWSIVNLMPILPWDGGALLDAGLEIIAGRPMPRVVGVVAMVTALTVAGLGALFKLYFLALFALFGIARGWSMFQRGNELDQVRELQSLLAAGNLAQVDALGAKRVEQASDAQARASMCELLAFSRFRQHDLAGAKRWLLEMAPFAPSPEILARIAAAEDNAQQVIRILRGAAEANRLTPTVAPLFVSALLAEHQAAEVPALLARFDLNSPSVQALWDSSFQKLYEAGAFSEAFQLSAKRFERTAQATTAYNAALCLSQIDRIDEAMAWLTRAFELGLRQRERLQNLAFEKLFGRSDFQAMLEKSSTTS